MCAAALLFGPASARADEALEADPFVVEGVAEHSEGSAGQQTRAVTAEHRGLDELLDGMAGVRIVRTGGAGSASQLSIRGLQGRRVATWLGPIRLDDPATGVLDLGEVPVEALDSVTITRGATSGSEGGLGGMLMLRPTTPLRPVLRGRLTWGSERSFGLDVAAGAPGRWRKLMFGTMVLARASSTTGVFSYTPVVGPAEQPFVLPARDRLNNDRTRIGYTAIAAGEWLGGPSATAVLDVATLHGGIPGYGVQPLMTSREEQTRLAAGVELDWPLHDYLHPSASFGARQSVWRFKDTRVDRGVVGALSSTSSHGTAAVASQLSSTLQLRLTALSFLDAARSRADAGDYTAVRPMAGVDGAVIANVLDGRLVSEASVRVQGWSGIGSTYLDPAAYRPQFVVMPQWRMHFRLVDGVRLEANVGRAWRLPSLEELYRPSTAALAGNPKLLPEDGTEAGGGITVTSGPLSGSAALYAARMTNLIAYVNINAFDVRPENVGDVWRGGGEVDARLALGGLGELRAGADVNLSRVGATGAPLPGVPPFELHATSQLGPPRAHLILDVAMRAAARGNLYGELPIRPALRINTGVRVGLLPGLAVLAMITNVTDDRSQTDLWGVPQPGREASVSIAMDPASAVEELP